MGPQFKGELCTVPPLPRPISQHTIITSIVNRGTGCETLPRKQWCCNLCWKGRDPAQSFVLRFTPQLNILPGTFLLVSCPNTFQNLLWFVHGQGQER